MTAPENEGYWTIDLNEYRYKGVPYSGHFSFYLIYNTSYTGSVQDNGHNYEASPNLLANGNDISFDESGTRFFKVEENTHYPVITYDYTKYELSYEVSAYGDTTYYRFVNDPSDRSYLNYTISGAKNKAGRYYMSKYNANKQNNIVSVMLTDIGDYKIHYKYIYTGYNYANAPQVNLTLEDERISISGVQLTYYNNLTQAQMKYATISKNSNLQHVDVIVPDGYERGSSAGNGQLMYSFDGNSNLRAGSTDITNTLGGDLNVWLNNYLSTGTVAGVNNVNSFAGEIGKYSTQTSTEKDNAINILLGKIKEDGLYLSLIPSSAPTRPY